MEVREEIQSLALHLQPQSARLDALLRRSGNSDDVLADEDACKEEYTLSKQLHGRGHINTLHARFQLAKAKWVTKIRQAAQGNEDRNAAEGVAGKHPL